eukprot:2081998-Amphidinium_carterae.1
MGVEALSMAFHKLKTTELYKGQKQTAFAQQVQLASPDILDLCLGLGSVPKVYSSTTNRTAPPPNSASNRFANCTRQGHQYRVV